MRSPDRRPTRQAVATTFGLLVGGAAFLLALLDYRTDLLRTAVQQRYASNFFDLQASALLHGRLDVPRGSLGIEGFVIDGKTLMYFPPFPALLRIPVQLVTHEFDGRLSLVSMAGAWVVLAVVTTKLLWLVRSLTAGARPLSRAETATAALVLALATGGTTLTFDAALPWVYHEVYLWSAALVLGSCYWMLRVALTPERPSVLWLGGFVLAAALTRTPGGWAVAGTTMFLGLVVILRRARRTGLGIAAAGAGPLAVAIGYNVVKFGHPYLFPLESQVWTTVNAHRREALEVNGGTITGPQFFETSLVNYFRPDGVRLVDYFPFITLPARPAEAYGGAFLDQSYRTGSVTALMPALLLLTAVALVALLWPRRRSPLAAVRWPMFAAVGSGGGVMGYGYLANRYTSDFVPALILGGVVGLWVLMGVLPQRRLARSSTVAALGVLTCFSVLAQLATGSLAAAQTWGGPRLVSYLDLQERISGGPGSSVASLVGGSDGLPTTGRADDLHITGDCAALYVNTGDRYEPWTLVQQRDKVVTVVPVFEDYQPGTIRLLHQSGLEERYVGLEFDAALPQARLVVQDADGNFYSPWFEVVRDRPVIVTAKAVPELGQVRVRVDDDPTSDLYLATSEWDADWFKVQSSLTFTTAADHGSPRHAVVSNRYGPVPTLCATLRSSASSR